MDVIQNFMSSVQRLGSQGSEDPKADAYRVLLCHLVDGVLTEPGCRQCSLNEQDVAVTLVVHCIDTRPQIFCHSYHDDRFQAPEREAIADTGERPKCQAMCSWLTLRLAALLARADAAELHGKCREAVTKLLRGLRLRDTLAYVALTKEHILLMADLAGTDKCTEAGRCSRRFCFGNVLLSPSGGVVEQQVYELKYAPLAVGTLHHASVLQMNLTHVICDVIQSASQFLDVHSLGILWDALCSQLDSNDITLKSATVIAIHEVIDGRGLPKTMQAVCRLVDCLLKLLQATSAVTTGTQMLSRGASATADDTVVQLLHCFDLLLGCPHLRRELSDLPAAWGLSPQLTSHLCEVIAATQRGHGRGILQSAALDLLIYLMPASLETSCRFDRAASDEVISLLVTRGFVNPGNSGLVASYLCKSAATAIDGYCCQIKTAYSNRLIQQAGASSTIPPPPSAAYLASLLEPHLVLTKSSIRSETEWMSSLESIVVILETVCQQMSSCVARFIGDGISSYADNMLRLWLPGDTLKRTISVADAAFRQSMHGLPCRSLQLMARLAEMLAFLADYNVGNVSRDTLMEFVAYSSLPWIKPDSNLLDLKLSNAMAEVREAAATVTASTCISPATQRACIAALASFTSDLAPQWRTNVMADAALNGDLNLSIAVTQSLPVFIHRVGSNVTEMMHALRDRSISMADSCDYQLAAHLATSVGYLACCNTAGTRLFAYPAKVSRQGCSRGKRSTGPDVQQSTAACSAQGTEFRAQLVDVQNASKSIVAEDARADVRPLLFPKCLICDNGTKEVDRGFAPCSLDVSRFVPFFQLAHLESRDTRRQFVGCIRRMLCHVKLAGAPGKLAAGPSNSKQDHTSHIDALLSSVLPLLADAERDVRLTSSHLVCLIVRQSNSDATNQVLVRHLRQLYDSTDTTVKVTVLATMGRLGARARVHDMEEFALAGLLDGLLSATAAKGPAATVAATAYTELRRMAAAKGMKPRSFFLQHQSSITKNVVELLQQEANKLPPGEVTACASKMLGEVAKVFDYADTKSMVIIIEPYLIPPLVYSASSVSDAIIRAMAAETGIPRKKLLVNQLQHVFCYVVQRWSPHDRTSASGKGLGSLEDLLTDKLGYIEREAEVDHGSLLRLRFQKIHNELLLHLSTHYQQVLRGIAYLVPYDDKAQFPGNKFTSEQLATYLESRLLGVLAHFDSLLLTATVPVEEKHAALSSLVSIMQFMGPKRITAVRMKVMTTLKLGLHFKIDSFNELCCRAWNCFVRSVEPAALGPMLPQIVVTLMPLLKSLPTQVAAIVKYLVVDCREQLREFFGDLHFLPELPELAELSGSLRPYKSLTGDGQDLRGETLECALRSVQHENADVRVHALAYLKRLLRKNQDRLNNLVISSETADPIILQMVQVLLTGCSRCTDAATRSAYGECLGEIGAIDPGRLEFQPNNLRKDVAKFLSGISDENFAFDLINELVQAFLSAENTHEQDCVALAIQEALVMYNVKKSTECKLWNRFTEEVREIATPYLDSKYILNNSTNWSNLPTPVYLSSKGANFKDWVCNWSIYLSYKVQDSNASRVFKFCMAAMSCRDLSLALYLLPHIVVHVLLGGNDTDTGKVQEEMMAVLLHAETSVQPTEFCHLSVQTVFSVLDHLRQWRTHRLPSDKKADDPATVDINKIDTFLGSIPKDLLSRVSFNCGIYTRALLHMEQHVMSSNQGVLKHLDFLLSIYARLDEPDAVAGVNALRPHQASLPQQILTHECTGQLREAAACYERAIQANMGELSLHVGLIKCLSGLSQWSTALTHVTGLVAGEPSWEQELNSYRVEAAWKLGDWNRLELFLQADADAGTPASTWDIGLGKLLLSAKHKDCESFAKHVQSLRSEQMGPLSAASMESGSFQRGYDSIVRLHMLAETEHACNILLFRADPLTKPELLSFLSHWDARLSLAQESFRVLEPILTLRRTLLGLALAGGAPQLTGPIRGPAENQTDAVETLLKHQIGLCWLQSARVASRANQMQTAYSFLLNAHPYNLLETFVEQATWLWQKGDRDQAQICLEKGIKEFYHLPPALAHIPNVSGPVSRSSLLQLAKALLLYARYNEENSSVDSNSIIRQYRKVIEECSDWEDGYFFLAKYYDKVMLNVSGGDKPQQLGQIVAYSVQNFGTSLQFGSRYIYQSLPRALSLWLDFGASVQQSEVYTAGTPVDDKRYQAAVATLTSQRGTLMQLNRTIATMAEKLSAYQWLTALPQLVSRICHAHPDVSEHLQDIIAKLVVAFPQQTMWNMMAVSKSSYPIRVQRCQSIFEKARSSRPDLKSFFHDATKLCDRLLDLCNKSVDSGTPVLSLSHDFRLLKRLTDDPNFSKILLPLQSAMTVVLPTSDLQDSNAVHNPFPGKQTYLQGFDETIEVLSSLQRPKKVSMLGDNGVFYPFLCKPKDDLRKDARLMDFNSVVNKLLRRDVECRRRELRIRTYMVTPLNEECGLLEWVPNTTSYRHIMIRLYREKGCYVSLRQAQSAYNFDKNAPTSVRIPAFFMLRERHPPVFGEWFLRTFPDPTTWYAARVSYAHTLAVMSIVGYILGLGDRHGENILFDSTNGDVVHVDFNCLFNKGETFDWPEVVPFRLTANMVEAMGPLGYEGIFRRACEVTLRVMREEIDPLMSVLKPFIYDPLVEWSKPVRRGIGAGGGAGSSSSNIAVGRGETGEINNEKAVVHVQNIEDRMKGLLKNKLQAAQPGLPLSIEGQVKRLILEATSEENLCRMYFGWAAYM